MLTFYLIRGLPGSGKSTLARTLSKNLKIDHFEADMYFTNERGEYRFQPSNIGAAHEWCYRQFENCIFEAKNVIVSNTFTRIREMEDYIDAALKANYQIKIYRCTQSYGSIHGVPEHTIEKMKNRFVSNEKLLADISLLEPAKIKNIEIINV